VPPPVASWPVLHAIVDADVCARSGWTGQAFAQALLDGGARFLQVRAKQLASGEFLALCDAIVAKAAEYGATVIVNDRADLALLAGAGGVHVGQEDLSVADVRRLLGGDAIVGFSTHSPEQLAAGVTTSSTYLAVGPVFGTVTKDTGYSPVGLELIREARRVTTRPVVAIGGVTLENASAALDAGATMVAVISDLLVGGNPERRVREYLERLTRS
jgi:thiamine-phosphate pyrophosphorylase